ncbi:hypothetical protein D9M71_827380 [compost metagenome]
MVTVELVAVVGFGNPAIFETMLQRRKYASRVLLPSAPFGAVVIAARETYFISRCIKQ